MLGEAPPEIKHPALIADEAVGSDSLNAEKLLREEIRSIRELWMRILQWGITVITGPSTIYARRSVKDDLVASAVLKIGEPLPLKVYLIGTAFLFLLAYIFYKLADTAANRYRVYVGQLVQFKTSGSTITFERKDFEREYSRRQSAGNKVTVDEALEYLYRFSVIG